VASPSAESGVDLHRKAAVSFVVKFDAKTVTLDALQRAVYALSDVASVDIRDAGSEYICEIFPKEEASTNDVDHRIRIGVIDQMLRQRIAEQTEPIRNLIFALAFSRTGLIPGEPPE
jgi:His-Xaa-Ser system protein HxsD